MQPPFPLDEEAIAEFIDAAFAEDIASGDVTCDAVIPADATLKATMNAREPMVLAGLPLIEPIFQRLDMDCTVTIHARDGEKLAPGSTILTVEGNAAALLSAERTALNILQHLSGIATLTNAYVSKIADTGTKLLDTRKTIPGLRTLAKYATAMGGAQNHRMGLFDAIMIKDNHIAVAGSVSEAVKRGKAHSDLTIQVECDTLVQVREALDAGADSLLLDNMPPSLLREALAIVDKRIPCEASGGIDLNSIRSAALTGVDYISVGRLTQSAPAVDIGLDFEN